MRPFENGALSLVRLTPMAYVTSLLGLAPRGTSMRCSSKSTDAFTTSGAPWIRMAMCSTFWSRATEIESCQEILSEAVKGVALCAADDHYRQAAELQRGQSCDHARCRTPPA